MELIMLTGAPGTGKSTWAREWCAEPNTRRAHIVVSGYRSLEETQQVLEALAPKTQKFTDKTTPGAFSVVLDGINEHARDIPFWESFARKHKLDFTVHSFLKRTVLPEDQFKVYAWAPGDEAHTIEYDTNPWLVDSTGGKVDLKELLDNAYLALNEHGCLGGIRMAMGDRYGIQSCDTCHEQTDDLVAAYILAKTLKTRIPNATVRYSGSTK